MHQSSERAVPAVRLQSLNTESSNKNSCSSLVNPTDTLLHCIGPMQASRKAWILSNACSLPWKNAKLRMMKVRASSIMLSIACECHREPSYCPPSASTLTTPISCPDTQSYSEGLAIFHVWHADRSQAASPALAGCYGVSCSATHETDWLVVCVNTYAVTHLHARLLTHPLSQGPRTRITTRLNKQHD